MDRFLVKDPGCAYISNNLLLPKAVLGVERPIKAALTIVYGEEEIRDEYSGELLRTKTGTLELWDETNNHLIVPREYLDPAQQSQFNFPFIDLKPTSFPTVDIDDHVILRNAEQSTAFNAMMMNHSGTLNLSCGKGKTVIALKVAATLKVPTIVVVNTLALLEQWKEEIVRHLGVRNIGTVQGSVADWETAPIVVAMVHTLSNRRNEWPKEFRRRFGLILYDEGHHMSAPVFVRSADLFYGRRFSLTATATRTDGLESVYQYHLGRVIHSDLRQELIPTTHFHVLDWEMPANDHHMVTDATGGVNLSRVRTYLGLLDWRNRQIVEDIQFDLASGRQILVLSHSVEHINTLHSLLSSRGAGMITGATPQEDRMTILRECNPVLGTFQLAREGLNKPSLDTLYVVTPFGNPNDMQQAWGRIQRQYSNKQKPIVRVYEDKAFSCCTRACRTLRRILKGWEYPVRRNTITTET